VTKAHLLEAAGNPAQFTSSVSNGESAYSRMTLNMKDRVIEVELVQVNDIIKVYPGQGVPVDGIVVLGQGSCNEAMLTGESRSVLK
jgi:P-type E1-E2 ATPase